MAVSRELEVGIRVDASVFRRQLHAITRMVEIAVWGTPIEDVFEWRERSAAASRRRRLELERRRDSLWAAWALLRFVLLAIVALFPLMWVGAR